MSFCSHHFNFPHPPEPPSTHDHIVDKELEEAQESVNHQCISYCILLPPPSHHHHHHMIDDGHCSAFLPKFPIAISFLVICSQIISCIVALSHFPTDFIWKSRFFFLTSISASKRCKVSGRGTQLAQWVASFFHPSSADCLASSSTIRSGSTPPL